MRNRVVGAGAGVFVVGAAVGGAAAVAGALDDVVDAPVEELDELLDEEGAVARDAVELLPPPHAARAIARAMASNRVFTRTFLPPGNRDNRGCGEAKREWRPR